MDKLAVVFFPNDNIEKINAFRSKYDSNFHIIPPHITLVSPLSGVSENELIEHIENVVKDKESFSIHLTGLTKTDDELLFLLVKEGSEKIIQLHDTLYSGLLFPFIPTDYPFIPHITLGEFTTKETYDKAYTEAVSLHHDIWCTLDSLTLIQGDGKSPAKTIKEFPLK